MSSSLKSQPSPEMDDPGKLSAKGSISIENIMPKIERTFLQVGSILGKYQIIEEIDRGGMAVVYRALQLDLDREVALKVLPANITINRKFVDRFLSEAHAVAHLSHPSIVSIHEVAMEDNIYFLAMEYIPGKNLYYYLHFAKPKLVDVLEITAILADALAYAHRQRIVHRDLKLNNVIMKQATAPVLIDFGLAKALESDEGGITQTGEIMGSPAYMAPERLLGGRTDARSDICSLGIMLYEMLTFKNPYLDPRSIHQTTMNVLESSPIPPRKLVPWLPPEIEAITLKAMQGDPEKRYQTMEEFRDDIRRYQRGEPVLARRPSLVSRARLFVRRHWPFLTIGVLSLLFISFLTLILYSQSRKEQPYWQLVCREDFSDSSLVDRWSSFPSPRNWTTVAGMLRSDGQRNSYMRLERPFTRDMRIEFDVCADGLELANAGLFVYGDLPESSYCFHLFHRGQARSGMTYPGSRFLIHENDPISHPTGKIFHVVVERKENLISFLVNDVKVADVWDCFPYLGAGHQKVGFFTDGWPCRFDNLRIYQLALPQLPGPAQIANRFWERGDFAAAIEEYTTLLEGTRKAGDRLSLMLRMSDCLLRTGGYADADSMLGEIFTSSSATEDQRATALHLKAILRELTGDQAAAQASHSTLNSRFPLHPANESAFIRSLLSAADSLAQGKRAGAYKTAMSLATMYSRSYLPLCGRIHLAVLGQELESGRADSVLKAGERLLLLYSKQEPVASGIRLLMGEAYLRKLQKREAVDIFNQCVSPVPTEATWKAWMKVASVYEQEFDYRNAAGIYHKVYTEAPRSMVLPYLARIKTAELGISLDSVPVNSAALLSGLNFDRGYTFPLPRMILRFYRAECTEAEFSRGLELLDGADPTLYYAARKAKLEGNSAQATLKLRNLRARSVARSWYGLYIERALAHVDRW